MYLKQTKLAEATASFQKAIELQPKCADGHNGLGQVLMHQSKWEEGFAALEKATQLDPDCAEYYASLALWLTTCPETRFRDPQRAIAASKKLVSLTPKSVMGWQLLGWANYQSGAWKASIDALEKSMALQQGGNAYQWFYVAMAHHQLGDKEAARTWFDRAVQWMEKGAPENEILRRSRLEAEEVLEIKKK